MSSTSMSAFRTPIQFTSMRPFSLMRAFSVRPYAQAIMNSILFHDEAPPTSQTYFCAEIDLFQRGGIGEPHTSLIPGMSYLLREFSLPG